MNMLLRKKEYVVMAVAIVFFLFVSMLSFSSINLLQGNARVVNYVGIVRGATQKLVKEEIMGWYLAQNDESFRASAKWYPDNALVTRLDTIIDELLTGKGPNGLIVLHDENYLANMRQVKRHWGEMKTLIAGVRSGEPPEKLFESSQRYFDLVNRTVFSAEEYSETQVKNIENTLIGINIVFVVLLATGYALYMRGRAVKRKADALDKIAYVDCLTKIANRASCERFIDDFNHSGAATPVAVFMLDMNDLKLTNDFLGHLGGDRLISAFANILKNAADKYGFVGRFGGDEFIAIFEKAGKDEAEAFLADVHMQVEAYNEKQLTKLEKIKYAVGYVLGIVGENDKDIDALLNEADSRMYANKRKLKAHIVT